MSGRKATTKHDPAGRHGERLRWARIATLATVLLMHLGLLAFLLAPPSGWRWTGADTPTVSPDVLRVRLLPTSPGIETPPPAAPHESRRVRNTPPLRRSPPVALSIRPTAQAVPQAAARSIDSLIVSAPPSYVAGGGRFAGPDYGSQNVRVPGSGAPVRGMPVFRMADPRWQGVAGVVRFLQRRLGALDPHCAELEAWDGMTPQERIDHHVDADAAQRAAMSARYGCPDPLKPGAAMYYFTHGR